MKRHYKNSVPTTMDVPPLLLTKSMYLENTPHYLRIVTTNSENIISLPSNKPDKKPQTNKKNQILKKISIAQNLLEEGRGHIQVLEGTTS